MAAVGWEAGGVLGVLKRLLLGQPRRSAWLGETLLPKWLALPVFCSDPISSVAYATQHPASAAP